MTNVRPRHAHHQLAGATVGVEGNPYVVTRGKVRRTARLVGGADLHIVVVGRRGRGHAHLNELFRRVVVAPGPEAAAIGPVFVDLEIAQVALIVQSARQGGDGRLAGRPGTTVTMHDRGAAYIGWLHQMFGQCGGRALAFGHMRFLGRVGNQGHGGLLVGARATAARGQTTRAHRRHAIVQYALAAHPLAESGRPHPGNALDGFTVAAMVDANTVSPRTVIPGSPCYLTGRQCIGHGNRGIPDVPIGMRQALAAIQRQQPQDARRG